MKRPKHGNVPTETANGQTRGVAKDSADALEEVARCLVAIPERQAVDDYLTLHPDLRKVLPDIAAHARQVLGPDAELSLEVYRDPEIDDRTLALYARLEQYGPETLDRIEQVNRQFDDRLENASGYFAVTTDFRRPAVAHGV